MNILKNKVNEIKESVNDKIEQIGKKRFTIIASCLSVLILAGGTATAVALTGGFNNMDKAITTSQTQNKTDEQNKDNKAEEAKQEEQATQNTEEGTTDSTDNQEATEENATAGDNNGATNNNTSNRGSGAGANNNANAGTSNVAPLTPSQPVHVHNWIPQYRTVHHYAITEPHMVCVYDGTIDPNRDHIENHLLNGTRSQTKEEDTVIIPAYDEQVVRVV